MDNIIHDWFSAFIELLKKLSNKSQGNAMQMSNEDFAAIGSSLESQQLIKELCGEIDEEYAYRQELEKVSDKEAWFEIKVKETLDDLADNNIIDYPKAEDYFKANNEIKNAITEGILKDAETVANELSEETEVLNQNESIAFSGKEDE
jgi:hypothetical protein